MYRKNKKTLVVMTVLLLIVFCTVGYAYLQRTLVINGDTTVQKNTWDVRFTTITPIRNDGEIITAPAVSNNTNIAFAVKLNKPGDTYIFTAIIENRGSLDAMISGTPIISGLEDMASYLEAHVTYADGTAITNGNLLRKDTKDTIRVTLNYKRNITEADIASLSESDVSKVMRLSISYIQADEAVASEVTHKLCIKADNLHTTTCQYQSGTDGCLGVSGYTTGSTITYGHTDSTKLVSGALTSGTSTGYALTCDVNGDHFYDEATERFYYVSDLMYYDTTNSEVAYDSNYATLIYYSNVFNKIPNSNGSLSYYSLDENWHGASSIFMLNMPTSTDWKNTLKRDNNGNSFRQIVNEIGETSATISGTTYNYPTYNYTSFGGRLLTRQEVVVGCVDYTNLNNQCEFLMENTKYEKSTGTYAYWLDTPNSSYSNYIYLIYGPNRNVARYDANFQSGYGLRPAIEVLKTNINLN